MMFVHLFATIHIYVLNLLYACFAVCFSGVTNLRKL